MKTYIGTKIIQAEPMDEAAFSDWKGQPVVIEGRGRLGYKVMYSDGYVTWSRKDVFDVAYREITEEEKTLLL